jgi:hypothetical protein
VRATVGSLVIAVILTGCGGSKVHASSTPKVVAVDRAAPAWIVRELRHTYEPIEPCPRPCPKVLREAHEHVVRMHRETALAAGTLPRAVAEASLGDGQIVTFYLYRSQTGQLCDDVFVTAAGRPVTGGLTPGLPCVAGVPCAAICVTQFHCCGANVLVGTVDADADEFGVTFDDGASVARYRLRGLLVPHRPSRRFFVLDLRPHDYADPVRLYAHGKVIGRGSVKGLG